MCRSRGVVRSGLPSSGRGTAASPPSAAICWNRDEVIGSGRTWSPSATARTVSTRTLTLASLRTNPATPAFTNPAISGLLEVKSVTITPASGKSLFAATASSTDTMPSTFASTSTTSGCSRASAAASSVGSEETIVRSA